MHFLSASRIRVVIFLMVLVILWQIFRTWPDGPTYREEQFTKAAGAPVLVMVFYEALCPDSKHFVLKQLQNAFYKAPSLIDFQFVPYGKASTSVNPDGTLKFECQHGPVECQANTYHACAIEAIQEPKILLDMVVCMITDNILPKETMIRCARENHIDYEPIQKCYDSSHGAELLKLHGEATNALRPRMKFVPTVTLDGYQGRQASILKDLFGEVCKVAAGRGPKPDVCVDIEWN